MRHIIIYYNKKQVKSGKPITLRVGKSSIHCDRIILENISGDITYWKNRNPTNQVKRLEISTPLIIPIMPEPPSDKALKERERYRNKK